MIQVVPYTDQHRTGWSEFVAASPLSNIGHQIGWREVIHKSMGHVPCYLIALDGSRVTGVLPMFRVQTWWRAKYLISIPWLDYAGICAEDVTSEEALSAEAARMASSWGAEFVELRSILPGSGKLATSSNRVTFLLKLERNPEEVWNRFDPKLRNQIRKSQKCELTTELGREEMLPGFYRVFCQNMRDLGTPVWGLDLFRHTLAQFPDSARIIQVKQAGAVIAAGLVLSFKDRLYVPSASAYRHTLGTCPNHALYWRLIEEGCRDKYEWFDFGRSGTESSTFKFKKQWTPEPTQLNWQYCLNRTSSIPEINPRNPKYRFFVDMWRRMPLPLANLIGPRVIRNFP